jgi:hypothetical protein
MRQCPIGVICTGTMDLQSLEDGSGRDSEELQAVLGNELGLRSGSQSRMIGVVPEPK